jgi:hypothetical protein
MIKKSKKNLQRVVPVFPAMFCRSLLRGAVAMLVICNAVGDEARSAPKENRKDVLIEAGRHILSGKIDDAIQRIGKTTDVHLYKREQDLLRELKEADAAILASFGKEAGKTIAVETQNRMVSVKIEGVTEKGIRFRVALGGGNYSDERQLPINELSFRERMKRLGKLSTEAKTLYAGLNCFRDGNFRDARFQFAKTVIFKEALVALVEEAQERADMTGTVPAEKPDDAPGSVGVAVPESIAAVTDLPRSETGEIGPPDINRGFGIDLWKDDNLWDDEEKDFLERSKWKSEFSSQILSIARSTPGGSPSLFGVATYSIQATFREGKLTEVTVVFSNFMDKVNLFWAGAHSPAIRKELEKKFNEENRDCGGAIRGGAKCIVEAMSRLLGKPREQSFGKRSTREKVLRWDWKEHAFLLVENDFALSLRILPKEVAENRTEDSMPVQPAAVKLMLQTRVVRKENGDVLLEPIPTLTMPERGYNACMTWTRLLWYNGINADPYVLAKLAEPKSGTGIAPDALDSEMNRFLGRIRGALKTEKTSTTIRGVAGYINQGIPLIWYCKYNRDFEINLVARNQKRPSENDADMTDWRKRIEKPRNQAKGLSKSLGRFTRLIVGYNEKTGEIAVSDNFGEPPNLRWITVEEADALSAAVFQHIRW